MKKFLIILVCFNLFIINAKSQNNWKGKLTIGSSFFKGNVNKFDLRSEGNIAHEDSAYELSGGYKVLYGENEHVENNREYYGIVKFDWRPHARFTPFLAVSAYNNMHKGYDLRLSGLAGGKYTIFKNDKGDYSLSAAFQYDIEQYTPPVNTEEVAQPDDEKFRLSIRPRIRQKITDAVYFEHVSFYKPNLNDFSDYQYEASTSLAVKLSTFVDFEINFEYVLDNKPPNADINREDISVTGGLTFKLK